MSLRRTTRAQAVRIGTICLAIVATVGTQGACSTDPESPKNVIVLIGDGMSFNQVDLTSLYEHGTSNFQVQVDPQTGEIEHMSATPSQPFEKFDVQVSVATYPDEGGYDPAKAWSDFTYVDQGPTDSAAAATAMASGVKTYNAGIGVDPAGNPVESLTERAATLGKATGVVTTVPFSHATPAGFAAHDIERDNFKPIADDYLASDIDVVMGAGHPLYTDDHTSQPAKYKYISKASWTALTTGSTPFTFVEDAAGFAELAASEDPPDRVFGVAQVASTLQQNRSGDATAAPYAVAFNDVPDLATLARGALNVLQQDPDGLFLMVEGGAIDKAGHDNQAGRTIEEGVAFNDAVDSVISWVETNSNWRETLVVVTADHETGYLTGPSAGPGWTALTGTQGSVPAVQWNSVEHTNSLVPLWAQGVGSEQIEALADADDPVRGPYLDNTEFARLMLDTLWAVDART